MDFNLSDYKFFITGANGMVGRSLVEAVLGCGGYVQAHVSCKDQVLEKAVKSGEIQYSSGDLCLKDIVTQAVDEFERVDRRYAVVFHGAAISDDTVCESDPAKALETNVQMVDVLLNALKSKNLTHVIFPSTAYVYGTLHQHSITEDKELKPQSIYPMTKMMAEHLVRDAFEKNGVCTYILRISNIYGDDIKVGTVIDAVLSKVKNGAIVMKNLKPVRDFIHLNDVIEAIIRLSLQQSKGGVDVFNVSTGRGLSVREIVDICVKTLKVDDISVASEFEGESNLVLDNNRLKQFLNWAPAISFEEGIARVLN